MRNSHPKPDLKKEIGMMTYTEFAFNLMNTEFTINNDRYRICGVTTKNSTDHFTLTYKDDTFNEFKESLVFNPEDTILDIVCKLKQEVNPSVVL
jgi:hypothetical protein